MDNSSGVGVLDKAALVLSALESGPATLAGLVAATGLARPTAHRLAVALEHHRMVARDMQGRFILGPRLAELAAAAGEDRLDCLLVLLCVLQVLAGGRTDAAPDDPWVQRWEGWVLGQAPPCQSTPCQALP